MVSCQQLQMATLTAAQRVATLVSRQAHASLAKLANDEADPFTQPLRVRCQVSRLARCRLTVISTVLYFVIGPFKNRHLKSVLRPSVLLWVKKHCDVDESFVTLHTASFVTER